MCGPTNSNTLTDSHFYKHPDRYPHTTANRNWHNLTHAEPYSCDDPNIYIDTGADVYSYSNSYKHAYPHSNSNFDSNSDSIPDLHRHTHRHTNVDLYCDRNGDTYLHRHTDTHAYSNGDPTTDRYADSANSNLYPNLDRYPCANPSAR
jgi:hypothetical protein